MRLQRPEQHVRIAHREIAVSRAGIAAGDIARDGGGDRRVLMFEREFHCTRLRIAGVRAQGEALHELRRTILILNAEVRAIHLPAG